jgi:hypothetical protein
MFENDPINTLAQWEIWRIESKILGTILGVVFLLVLVVLEGFFALSPMTIVYGIAVISVPVLVVRFARGGRSTAYDEGVKMMHKAMGPDWNKD